MNYTLSLFVKRLFALTVGLFCINASSAPFDKTGLIDMQSASTIAGSCYGVTYASQLTAMGMGDFDLADRYDRLNKVYDSMMTRGDGNSYMIASQAWQTVSKKIQDQTRCQNCLTASNYCATLLRR